MTTTGADLRDNRRGDDRAAATFVSHNINHNGEPTLVGHVVGTQETNQASVRRSLPDHRHRFIGGLGLSWDPERFDLLEYRRHRLHPSGQAFGLRGFSPTRWLQEALFTDTDAGVLVAVLHTHLVDSAWEKGPSHPWLRRRLWRRSVRVLRRRVRDQRRQGHHVVVLGDFNIARRPDTFNLPGYLGLMDVAGAGLDWVLATPGLDSVARWTGAHTGVGRHTHASVGVALAVVNRKEKP